MGPTAELRQFIEYGRSTPGPKQPKHAGADWWQGIGEAVTRTPRNALA